MPRRHGPTNGAGSVIIEKEGGKSIQPADTGTKVYVGMMEKGAVGELNDAPNLSDYLRKCGTYFEGSELPEAAFDFYNLSGGAGRLYGIRVTDGNEVAALDHSWSRDSAIGSDYVDRALSSTKGQLVTITAKNGGRWGGAQALRYGDFTTGGDLTETTLATNQAMLEDEWAGATLRLFGVTSRTYKVISNDVAGAVTVESDSTMGTDLAGDTPLNETYALVLDTVERSFTATGQTAGDRQALSYMWKDGEEDASLYFGLDILIDGSIVRSYPNLSLDTSSKWYIGAVVGEDPDNDYVDVTVDHGGSITPANRPANWWGEYTSFTGSTMGAKVWQASYTLTNSLAGYISTLDIPAKCVRQKLTLTFTDATNFNITSDADFGLELEDGVLSGVVGTPLVSPNDYIPGLSIVVGQELFVAGDTIVIEVIPFPVDLATGDGLLVGFVYVDAGAGSTVRVQIESNTVDEIVFKNNPTVAPTPAAAIRDQVGVIDIGTVITFPTASVALDLEISTDDDGYEQIAIIAAVYADMTALLSALNGAVASIPAFFAEGTADTLGIDPALYTVTAGNENVGKDSFVHVIASVTAELNITDDTYYTGTAGDEFRLQVPTELFGGYDGSDPLDADYLAAFNTATSVINRLRGRNVGLVKIAVPGVTTTAIQKAGLAYAFFRNYQFRVEIPASITSEPSAVGYINDTIGRNDHGVTSWPSYGYVTNPKGAGLVLQTLTGAIHGDEAAVARDYSGYHKAAAGQSVTIPHMIKSPLGEAVPDEEILNPQGINVIKKLKGNFVVWGDRTIALDPAWKWKHQREYMSHIEAILLESYDWLIFEINDEQTQSGLIATFQSFFYPEWQKRALRGATFEEAVGIKIDEENNTNLTRANGDLNAEISLRLADTVERFIITIGKLGIFDRSG